MAAAPRGERKRKKKEKEKEREREREGGSDHAYVGPSVLVVDDAAKTLAPNHPTTTRSAHRNRLASQSTLRRVVHREEGGQSAGPLVDHLRRIGVLDGEERSFFPADDHPTKLDESRKRRRRKEEERLLREGSSPFHRM